AGVDAPHRRPRLPPVGGDGVVHAVGRVAGRVLAAERGEDVEVAGAVPGDPGEDVPEDLVRLAGDAHRDVVSPGDPAVGRDGGDDRLRLAETERVRVAGGGVVADRGDPVRLHDGVVVSR